MNEYIIVSGINLYYLSKIANKNADPDDVKIVLNVILAVILAFLKVYYKNVESQKYQEELH